MNLNDLIHSDVCSPFRTQLQGLFLCVWLWTQIVKLLGHFIASNKTGIMFHSKSENDTVIFF